VPAHDPAMAPVEDTDNTNRACPVRIRYRRPEVSGWIVLGEDWQIRPDQALIHELHQLLGQQAVSIAYR